MKTQQSSTQELLSQLGFILLYIGVVMACQILIVFVGYLVTLLLIILTALLVIYRKELNAQIQALRNKSK